MLLDQVSLKDLSQDFLAKWMCLSSKRGFCRGQPRVMEEIPTRMTHCQTFSPQCNWNSNSFVWKVQLKVSATGIFMRWVWAHICTKMSPLALWEAETPNPSFDAGCLKWGYVRWTSFTLFHHRSQITGLTGLLLTEQLHKSQDRNKYYITRLYTHHTVLYTGHTV